MEKLLTFDDVELYYDHVYALKGVSLEVNEGETVALIGANGAGKSSILRAITGLKKPRKGEIRFRGKRIDGTGPDEIVRRAMKRLESKGGGVLLLHDIHARTLAALPIMVVYIALSRQFIAGLTQGAIK